MTDSEQQVEESKPITPQPPKTMYEMVMPALTGQTEVLPVLPALPRADEPMKFPWEEPLPGGQGSA